MELIRKAHSYSHVNELKYGNPDGNSFDHSTLNTISFMAFVVKLLDAPTVTNCIRESWKEVNVISLFSLKDCREKVEDIVVQIVNEFHLPALIRTNILDFCSCLVFHLFLFLCDLWKGRVNVDLFLSKRIPLYFTVEGTVDEIKSLNELMKYETTIENSTNKRDLYILACNYCLEEYISVLWPSLSTEEQNRFKNISENIENPLIAYWTAVHLNELDSLFRPINMPFYSTIYYQHDENRTINQKMTMCCIYCLNSIALKHIWYKLTTEEKRGTNAKLYLNLVLIFKMTKNGQLDVNKLYAFTDIITFLMSHFPIQIKEVMKCCSGLQLLAWLFQDWSFQKYFSPTTNLILNWLSESKSDTSSIHFLFKEVLQIQHQTIEEMLQKENILCRLWCISPSKMKKLYIQSPYSFAMIILNLLAQFDQETVDMLLIEATPEEKKKIFLEMYKIDEFYMIGINRGWNYIYEVLSSPSLTNLEKVSFKLNSLMMFAEMYSFSKEIEEREEFMNWAFQLHGVKDINKLDLNPKKIYLALVFLDDYKRVRQFFSWGFEVEKYVFSIQDSLCNANNVHTIVKLMKSCILNGSDGWDRFEEFINKSMCSFSYMKRFKKRIVQQTYSILNRYVFYQYTPRFCTLFLNWCLNSSRKTIRFKNELMISEQLINGGFYENLLCWAENASITGWKNVIKYIKWFSPRPRTARYLKDLLNRHLQDETYCQKCNSFCSSHSDKAVFYAILDDAVTGDNSSMFDILLPFFNLEDLRELSN